MALYHNLFYLVYSFLKGLESGYNYQNRTNRVLFSIFIISYLEISNLVSINPSLFQGEVWLFSFATLLLINFHLFFYKEKYTSIVKKQQEKSNNTLNYISATYIIASAIAHLYINVFN